MSKGHGRMIARSRGFIPALPVFDTDVTKTVALIDEATRLDDKIITRVRSIADVARASMLAWGALVAANTATAMQPLREALADVAQERITDVRVDRVAALLNIEQPDTVVIRDAGDKLSAELTDAAAAINADHPVTIGTDELAVEPFDPDASTIRRAPKPPVKAAQSRRQSRVSDAMLWVLVNVCRAADGGLRLTDNGRTVSQRRGPHAPWQTFEGCMRRTLIESRMTGEHHLERIDPRAYVLTATGRALLIERGLMTADGSSASDAE